MCVPVTFVAVATVYITAGRKECVLQCGWGLLVGSPMLDNLSRDRASFNEAARTVPFNVCQPPPPPPQRSIIKIETRPPRLGVWHEADNLILEKMTMLRSPKKEVKAERKGLKC
jgi:hypothetical protein